MKGALDIEYGSCYFEVLFLAYYKNNNAERSHINTADFINQSNMYILPIYP